MVTEFKVVTASDPVQDALDNLTDEYLLKIASGNKNGVMKVADAVLNFTPFSAQQELERRGLNVSG